MYYHRERKKTTTGLNFEVGHYNPKGDFEIVAQYRLEENAAAKVKDLNTKILVIEGTKTTFNYPTL